MRDVIAEAVRDPDSCPHVKCPIKPIVLHGHDPSEMLACLDLIADQAVSKAGTKLRKDARILLSGVASYPLRCTEIKSNEDKKLLIDWKNATLSFLKSSFGYDLRSVVMHMDESHPHFHFYVHEDLVGGTLSLANCHPAYKAESALPPGSTKKSKEAAGKKALADFCDAYHSQVGSRFGHARATVKRKRLDNLEYKKQQAQSQLEQKRVDELKSLQEKVSNLSTDNALLKTYLKNSDLKIAALSQKLAEAKDFIVRYARDRGLNVDRVLDIFPKF